MSFKEKFSKYYADAYLQRYGDRLTQVQGNIISVKVQEKTILWIFHKIIATIVVKPEGSRSIVKSVYRKNRWFKKPTFIKLLQGHYVMVQGLKPKKNKKANKEAYLSVINILNLSTKQSLIPIEGDLPKVQKIKMDKRFK